MLLEDITSINFMARKGEGGISWLGTPSTFRNAVRDVCAIFSKNDVQVVGFCYVREDQLSGVPSFEI